MIDRCVKILADLVAFDTTSRHSNLALIEAIGLQFDALDIPYELTFNQERTKANLFATIGDENKAGLVLSGHTDVVPVDGQEWSSNPFTLVERDARLYGRGSCDMKGFVAVCLAMAETFKLADLPIPIHFAFSYDEEVGCLGVRELLAGLEQRPVKPLACIVGEPSEMQLIAAHKGYLDTVCSIRGCAGHSSLPDRGVNAIAAAADLVARLRSIAGEIKRDGPFDARFDPPYSTMQVGRIAGGTAVNIIPELCEFEYEIRNIPGQDPEQIAARLRAYAEDQLLPAMRAVFPGSEIRWTRKGGFPALDTPESADVSRWVKSLPLSRQQAGAVSYGTEAGLFSEFGIPTVVCGPGSIRQAHRPDEYVERSELEACIEFQHSIIEQLQQGNWPGQEE